MPNRTSELAVAFRDALATAGGRISKDQALAWLRENAPDDLDLSNPSKLNWVLGYGAKISTRWWHQEDDYIVEGPKEGELPGVGLTRSESLALRGKMMDPETHP